MHPRVQRRAGILAAGTLILTGLGAAAFAAEPQTDSVIADSSSWYAQAYDNVDGGAYLTPQQANVTGPQRAPFGTSSHRMTIGESTAQTELYRTNAYDGVNLSDLTRLEYSEFASSSVGGADRQPVYLRLSVDTTPNDGTDSIDHTLYFFPADNGTVTNGQWQNWDVGNGKVSVDGDNGPNNTTTLAAYAAANPGAKLVNTPSDPIHPRGSLALIAGGALGGDTDPQTNGTYYVDRVIVGNGNQDTLYDLGGNNEVSGGTSNLTVNPANDQGWKFQAYNDTDYLTPNQTFVDGPAVPPLGNGSVRATLTPAQTNRVELFRTTQYDGTLLRDLRAASYSTYVAGNSSQQPHYMRLSIDNNGDGTTDDSLFYFPANNGAVQQNTWQNWDTIDGIWKSGGDSGVGFTLAQYLVAHPDATIVANADSTAPTQPHGGVAFLVGAGGNNQNDGSYYLDNVTISKADDATGHLVTGKRFDLEPTLPTLSIGDTSVSEGNSGATLTFPVTLSRPVARATSVHFATSNGTAKSGSDYRATSGTLTIPAGSTTGTVRVGVVSDKVREANETMTVTLSSPDNATLADGTAVGTILNDDTAVSITLRHATQHRVRVQLVTSPAAAGAPVTIYRVGRHGHLTAVASTTLNSSSRLSVRLGTHYRHGARVTFVAVVHTANGLYSSRRATITIR